MTLGEMLTQCKNTRRGRTVRVFVGSTTLFNGDPSKMSVSTWVKLHPYFNCKVLNRCMIKDTFVITL